MAVRRNSITGTVGKALMEHHQELSKANTEELLDNFIEELLPQVEGTGKIRFYNEYRRRQGFEKKAGYVYNYLLAGEGLRAEDRGLVFRDSRKRLINKTNVLKWEAKMDYLKRKEAQEKRDLKRKEENK